MQLSFFPQSTGEPATKQGFTATVLAAAGHLKMDDQGQDNLERFTGHSLRATGAQGLATLGVDTYSIQLLGRWGSGVVLKYVRGAAVSAAAAAARAASTSLSLRSLASRVAETGATGETVTERTVTDLIEIHLPGALARARPSMVEELTQEMATRTGIGSPRSSASSASTPSTASTAGPPAAALEDGLADAGPAAPPPPAEQQPPLSPDRAVHGLGGQPAMPREVSNTKHKRRHVIRVGPPILDPATWTTICGWRFGRSGWAGVVDLNHKPCHRCARGAGFGLQ